jgi:hypothetical protein
METPQLSTVGKEFKEFKEFRRSHGFGKLGIRARNHRGVPEQRGSGVTEYCFVLSCGIWLILELL